MKKNAARLRRQLHNLKVPAVRRIGIAVVGGSVLLVGLALLVLPGPAFIVIPLGLAILATEFVWAKRWLNRARAMLSRKKRKAAPGGGREGGGKNLSLRHATDGS